MGLKWGEEGAVDRSQRGISASIRMVENDLPLYCFA